MGQRKPQPKVIYHKSQKGEGKSFDASLESSLSVAKTPSSGFAIKIVETHRKKEHRMPEALCAGV